MARGWWLVAALVSCGRSGLEPLDAPGGMGGGGFVDSGGAGANGGLAASGRGRGAMGGAGAGGQGGSGGGEPETRVCPDAGFVDGEALVLAGIFKEELVLLQANGRVSVIDRSASFASPSTRLVVSDQWIGVLSRPSTMPGQTFWDARLYDVRGRLRTHAPDIAPYSATVVPRWTLHQRGLLSIDFSDHDPASERMFLLRPDGRVLEAPYFDVEPDEQGWVSAGSANSSENRPQLLHVESATTREPSYPPVRFLRRLPHAGPRMIYPSQREDRVVLIDEDLNATLVVDLTQWDERNVYGAYRPVGAPFVVITVNYIPAWSYQLRSATLYSNLPEGEGPEAVEKYTWNQAVQRLDQPPYTAPSGFQVMSDAASHRPVWSFDAESGIATHFAEHGVVFERAARLHVGDTWALLVEPGAHPVYVPRGASGAQRLSFDFDPEGPAGVAITRDRLLLSSGGIPRMTVDLRDLRATDSLAMVAPVSRLEAGHGWVLGGETTHPVWGVDVLGLRSAHFPPPPQADAQSSVRHLWPGSPNVSRTTSIVRIENEQSARVLFASAGNAAWRSLGYPLREVHSISARVLPHGFLIVGETDTFAHIVEQWQPLREGAEEHLIGQTYQLLSSQGAIHHAGPEFPHLDPSETCAVVAGQIIDLSSGTRRTLALDSVAWAPPAAMR